ncbi:hypothetical protein V6N12_013329 [Hibiscus sabdariffa]|uniref:RNase H type-1 domain-containing protein n=1 Tax=Hibiscus sabdariffa TaxID=183260 RepID=A0ABR2D733_9ROSI
MLKCLSTFGIKREHPPSGWLKLDTDGSALVNTGRAGAGVLIPNNPIPGEWMMRWEPFHSFPTLPACKQSCGL